VYLESTHSIHEEYKNTEEKIKERYKTKKKQVMKKIKNNYLVM